MLVLTNPANKTKIAQAFKKNPDYMLTYNIVYDAHIPPTTLKETGRIIGVPRDRFVLYEESDWPWLIALGIAYKETVEEPLIYLIDNSKLDSMNDFLYSPIFSTKPSHQIKNTF